MGGVGAVRRRNRLRRYRRRDRVDLCHVAQGRRHRAMNRFAIIVAVAVLNLHCAQTPEEKQKTAALANVRRIAVVTFVGQSSVSPKSATYRRFTSETLAAFNKEVEGARTVVEIVPAAEVV